MTKRTYKALRGVPGQTENRIRQVTALLSDEDCDAIDQCKSPAEAAAKYSECLAALKATFEDDESVEEDDS